MVVNLREHVGEQPIGDVLDYHVAVNPSAEPLGFRKTAFRQLPGVVAGESFRELFVELRVCLAIEVQAEILVTGRCIPRRGKIQVGPSGVHGAIGGSLQAAGKAIDGEHLQVSCLPGTRESAPQVLRPFRRGRTWKNSSMSLTAACSSEKAPRRLSRSSARGTREITGLTMSRREFVLFM